jgi:carotenoid cleavage dioxygenase-like enzyme
MYYNNSNPVSSINRGQLRRVYVDARQGRHCELHRKHEFVATPSKYAGGSASYSPVVISHTGWTATASFTAAGTTAAGGIDGVNAGSSRSG